MHVDLVETDDLEALKRAVRAGKTKLVWIETPANPLWTITDMAATAEIAHAAGARLAVDSTAASPVHTRPLALGADIVMHAATKVLNGHSDVIAGVLAAAKADAFWERLVSIRKNQGAILGPFEAYLLLRGLRTLHLRAGGAGEKRPRTCRRLSTHLHVARVLYPGLPQHPGHEVAARQMEGGFGYMLSIQVTGGEKAAVAAAAKVRLWKRATSLGGVESLIEHRASVEGPGTPCPPDLLRSDRPGSRTRTHAHSAISSEGAQGGARRPPDPLPVGPASTAFFARSRESAVSDRSTTLTISAMIASRA